MLFMMIVKASKNSECKNIPQPHLEVMMDQYNQDLINAGVGGMAKDFIPSSERIHRPNFRVWTVIQFSVLPQLLT